MPDRKLVIDADTIDYRFTVEDPTAWSKPWTVADENQIAGEAERKKP